MFIKAALLSLTVAAVAAHHGHGDHHPHHHFLAPRQGSTTTTTTTASTTTPRVTSTTTTTTVPRPGGSVTTTTTTTTLPGSVTTTPPLGAVPTLSQVPISPLSTNPTAVPYTNILPGVTPTHAIANLPVTAVAGSKPSNIPSAPPLPDLRNFGSNRYPPLDLAPPTDSPEVVEWIQQVADSGIQVPNIAPRAKGGCAANPGRIGNITECWWTCGHCVRDTDIVECKKKNSWGSSFDDGPSPSTADLLIYLQQQKITTTFFVVGSRCASRPEFLQAEYIMGHQIAVHTWSHTPLTEQTTEQIIAELGWSKKVIHDVLGVTPKYMRPPFGDMDDRVRAISLAMGLQPVIWTIAQNVPFDTMDWEVPGGIVSASQVIAQFEAFLKLIPGLSGGFIVLAHDLFQQEVDLAVGYIIPEALAVTPKLTIEPIITCTGLTAGDAYVETNNNQTNPPLVVPPSGFGGVGAGSSAQGGKGAGMMGVKIERAWVGAGVALALGLVSLI